MYAYDILISYKGTNTKIKTLINLFHKYSIAYVHHVNTSKAFIYLRSIPQNKLLHILHQTGFSKGTLPFLCIGVPIFKGKAKLIHLKPIVDKIKAKLAS